MKELREAVRLFGDIADWHDPFAVTLTMRRYADTEYGSREAYVQNFRFFLTLLSRQAFGNAAKRGLKRLRSIPVVETDRSGREHYHAALDRPPHIDRSEFEKMIRECWAKSRWGFHQVHIVPGADEGWIDYMTKWRSKANFADAIDWENFHNN